MKRVCVLGAGGFLGRNIVEGTTWVGLTRADLNLLDQEEVEKYFLKHNFDVVVHCAVQGGSRLVQDDGDVTHNNILMFENVVRVFKGLLLYFSSGAALEGNPPTKPYGLSKWIIERRIELIERAHYLRIWGCYGPGEAPTRFSAICKTQRHVVIDQDRYFDFIDVRDVKQVVCDYIEGRNSRKNLNLIYPEKRLLSQWAEFFGATFKILEPGLGEPYCFSR